MGCAGSKIEETELVLLCGERKDLLLEAIRLRYNLADAHSAYILSIRNVGEALEKFFDGDPNLNFQPSPVITLPTQRKGDPMPPLSPQPATLLHSKPQSGSHLHFENSESDFSEDEDEHLHSLSPKSHVNLAKKVSAGPVTSYEIPPPASPGYGYGFGYGFLPQSSGYGGTSYDYPYSSYPNLYGGSPPLSAASPSSSKQPLAPPPPPPSPPKVSTWEFLNPFESYNNYYPSYAMSQNSSELREEEGIPDLEEDEIEVIKEAIVDQKHASPGSSTAHTEISSNSVKAKEEKAETSAGGANEAVKEVTVKEVATRKLVPQSRAAAEAMHEIKDKFLSASQSCEAVSMMLEVGKRPSRRIRDGGKSSTKIGVSFPSVSSIWWSIAGNGDLGDNEGAENLDDDMLALSTTLQKLFIWETKLYDEVKAEEEMRRMHDRKVRLLLRLDEKGAESDRISTTQAKVKKLATRIGVAIQVVDTISTHISMLRDEELWPQLRDLIQGLAKMWSALVVCHKSQLEAVVESMSLDAAAAARGDVAKELEFSLLDWIERFSHWYNAQRKFARAMNSWLLRIIEKEPEETADGPAPFSPGRLGAPPVFVVCNQWSQAMQSTSDVEDAVSAMRLLASSVLHFWDRRHRAELPVAIAGSKDQARLIRAREKEEREIYRAVETLDRKLVPVGDGARENRPDEPRNLHDSLRMAFEAMERLSESSVRIYEGLLMCSQSEQERHSGEN